MTASSTEPGPGAAADRPALPGWGSIVRAIPTALLLMLILVVPAFLLGWFSNPASFGVVYLGSMVAWLVMISAGLRAALAASVALLLLTPLALLASQAPIAGACLMAIACLASGLTSVWGLNLGFRIVPLYLAFLILSPPALAPGPVPVDSQPYIYTIMFMLGFGAGWVLLCGRVGGSWLPQPHLISASVQQALGYTALMAFLCSVSTFVVMTAHAGHAGAWLILTLLIVLQVAPEDTWSRTKSRVIGTVVGAVIAAGVGFVATSATALAIWGSLFVLISIIVSLGPRYWLYVTFLTPAVILLTAQPGGVMLVDAERVGYTIIGSALAVLAALVLVWTRAVRLP